MLIYIVEDDDNIRELEAFAMKNSGYDTECFASSKGFYQAINKAVPDLILLDIMLPGDDGLAILSKLRDDPVNDEQKEKTSGHRHDHGGLCGAYVRYGTDEGRSFAPCRNGRLQQTSCGIQKPAS